MKIHEAPNLNYAWAELIIEELIRNGVNLFCIAPGSRSAPLVAAVAHHPKARTVIHYDERGLAFYALGHISITRKPAVLICTSGTAAANFFPAVIETSKKKLPLILLTADRPPELRETGAHQTIDQVKLYGNYVRWFMDLPAPDLQIKPETLLTTIDQAVFRSKDPMPGPVHLNCMFREPLAPDKTGFNACAFLEPIDCWLKNDHVYTSYTKGNTRSDFSHDQQLLSIFKSASRGIIVVGKLGSLEEQQAVLKLSEELNWPVFPDIVSGLRSLNHPNIIHYYDQVLLSDVFIKKFPVDTVLHLGGRITSKRWYGYCEKMRPVNYISVLSHSLRNDPLHIVSLRVKSRVLDFIESCLRHPGTFSGNHHGWMVPLEETPQNFSFDNEYFHWLRRASETAGRIINEATINRETIDEIDVARIISQMIPPAHGLFLSNSMAVREMDMYAFPGGENPIIGGNRGASGIDGVIASACGFAHALDTGTTLFIGDLAFLHDLNSLALVKNLEKPLIIVVTNNDGGGIFSFLPIAAASPVPADIFTRYFCTPHGLEFSRAAQMFNLDYSSPKTMTEFKETYRQALKKALKTKKSAVIEVMTDRKQNYKWHMELQSKIKAEIDELD